MEYPLIYCNGDSYSNENYHPSLKGKTYANTVAEYSNGFFINKALTGSCNRRIIRTTVHDAIHQRKLNPTQKIIMLIGLSFDIRSELWIDKIASKYPAEESNFRTHKFTDQLAWRENLLNGTDIETKNWHRLNEKFYKKFSAGRAFFYSPYAERINLLTDLLMLKSLLESLNIDFLIFQCPKTEKLETDYLLDFLKEQIKDDLRFIDFENFGFVDWCNEQKFTPLDYSDRPNIGHYGPDAHKAFAEKIVIPKLQTLGFL